MKKGIVLLESTNKQVQESDDEKYIFFRVKDKYVFFLDWKTNENKVKKI